MPTYPHAGLYPPNYWPDQFFQLTPFAHIGIYTDEATTTLATLWEDRDRVTAAANPIVLTDVGNSDPFYANPGTYWAARMTNNAPGTPVLIQVGVDPEDAVLNAGDGVPGAVFYGDDPTVARPAVSSLVFWEGYDGTDPVNAEPHDIVVKRGGPDVAPATPASLTATVDNASVLLNWDDNTELDLDHYEYRRDGGSAVSTGLASNVTVTGLTNGQLYTFEVRALDAAGNASAWATVTATPNDAVPAVPTGLSVVGINTKLVANWNDNTEADLLRYEYRVDGGAPVSTLLVSGATITGLTNDQSYSVQVRALDAASQASAWSTAVVAAPSSAFNPIYQLPALVALWADDPLQSKPADGGTVSLWRNGGTAAVDWAASGAPIYHQAVAGLNNKGAIGFDGVSARLRTTLAQVPQKYTELIVFLLPDAPGVFTPLLQTNAASAQGLAIASNNKYQLKASSTLVANSPLANASAHVLRGVNNGASSAIYLDGTAIASGNAGAGDLGSTITAPNVTIAADGQANPALFANVTVAFAAVYDSAVDDADIAQLVVDLKTYYAIT